MFALFNPKVPKILRPKSSKMDVFEYPTVVCLPSPGTPTRPEYLHKTYIARSKIIVIGLHLRCG